MLIRRRPGWALPESAATPEPVMLARRKLMGASLGAGAGLALGATPARAQWFRSSSGPAANALGRPRAPLAARHSDAYPPGRDLTPEQDALSYNNFYEFNTSKSLVGPAQALKIDPWSIELAGLVANPRRLALEDLLRQVSLEERVYRHRCVEAWAMTVPWVGFPLAELVRLAEPQSGAKYLVFTTQADRATMPGLRQSWYPWPYTEGCTLEEAANELAFLAVGMYGQTLARQNGAPIRLVLPWKYGFKSAKSLVRVEFSATRPVNFWQALQASEYGFWANVNPAVPHPRWSQAEERLLGSNEMVPTRIWNGYGEWVAGLYDGLKGERLFA